MDKKKVDIQLTSVKLLSNIYQSFKILGIQHDTSLQRVVNRSIFLYLTDREFRDRVDEVTELEISGSNF